MFRSRKLKNVSNAVKSVRIPDVSSGVNSKLFSVKELGRYGIEGRIVSFAYDHTQSLLAVATDSGEVHVYGQQQVEVVFVLENRAPITELRFVKGIYLVATDSKDAVIVLSLYSKKILASVFVPGKITCIETDPSLDWLFIGLQSGTVLIYDVDRDSMSNLQIGNLQKSRYFTKSRLSPVISLQLNPRDIGTILIAYENVALTYSFVENEVTQHFIYELPPYAPGGDHFPISANISTTRYPKIIQALYHPNSLHILTVHEDNSLVFWDANSGQLIQARTEFDVDVHIPQPGTSKLPSANTPTITKVLWICQNNPEYTSLLLVSKFPEKSMGGQSLTMLDLGGTPLYSMTTYEGMSKYYANVKQQKMIPLNNTSSILKVLPLPKRSPFFAGCHDPGVILLLLEDGEIETMLYPSGSMTYRASLFPQGLAWIRPNVTKTIATSVPKKLWLGMMAAGKTTSLLRGGSPVKKAIRAQEIRSALLTGHTNGAVRIWDASHSELDESSVFEINLSRVLNRATDLSVDNISFASETLELATSVENGDVVLFKFGVNQLYSSNASQQTDLELKFRRFSLNSIQDTLVDVRDRAPTNISKGFMPGTVIHVRKGAVSALCNSDVGFVAIAYENGTLILVDRRGPAIIYNENVAEITNIRGRRVTSIQFFVMEYANDGYSSILIVCGTDMGELLTFKILPDPSGRFTVEFMDMTQANESDAIQSLHAFDKVSGTSCCASVTKMQDLSKGVCNSGYIVSIGFKDIRLVTPGLSKETHKLFKTGIASASVVFVPYIGSKGVKKLTTVVAALFMNGEIRVLSVPELREIKSTHIPMAVQSRYVQDSSVLENGDIIVRLGQHNASLLSMLDVKASGIYVSPNQDQEVAKTDTLYNPSLKIPSRPQVNSLQWARGTVYCSPDDLSQILAGDNRPPSKYTESGIAKGTISTSASKKNANAVATEHAYEAPVRHSRKTKGYSVFKGVSRVVENQIDSIEGTLNDYATAIGETMSDAMDQTGQDVVKGAMGF